MCVELSVCVGVCLCEILANIKHSLYTSVMVLVSWINVARSLVVYSCCCCFCRCCWIMGVCACVCLLVLPFHWEYHRCCFCFVFKSVRVVHAESTMSPPKKNKKQQQISVPISFEYYFFLLLLFVVSVSLGACIRTVAHCHCHKATGWVVVILTVLQRDFLTVKVPRFILEWHGISCCCGKSYGFKFVIEWWFCVCVRYFCWLGLDSVCVCLRTIRISGVIVATLPASQWV